MSQIVARYTASTSGVVPTFNSGYEYTINETKSGGIYTVEINSDTDFTSCKFDGKSSLKTIEYLKITNKVTDMQYMFRYCSSLTELDVSNWDVSNVTNMLSMFHNCGSLIQLDASNWNTSNVTDMYGMFHWCSKLKQVDLSNWNIKKVIYMYGMFESCSSLTQLDIRGWDATPSNISMMFHDCSKLSKVIVDSPNVLTGICRLLPENDSNGVVVYAGSIDGLTLKNDYWTLVSLFAEYNKIAEYKFDSTSYDLFPVFNEGFEYTYVDEYLDTEDITTTITETMTIMNYDAVPDEYGVLTTEYEVENVNTFAAENIVTRTIYSDELPTLMRFGGLPDIDGNTPISKTQSLLEVLYMNTSNINNMSYMFRLCNNLIRITCDWNTSNVQNAREMFHTCQSLIDLNISSLDVSQINTTGYMFYDCRSLTSLDISNWNINNVVGMNYTFHNCSKLNNIIMNNSDYNSINKIISVLPTRTADSPGILDITGVDDISQVDVATAESKYWNVAEKQIITKYKFDKSVYDFFPEFNKEFTDYTYEDEIDDNIVIRTIISVTVPTQIRFGNNVLAVSTRTSSLLEVLEVNTSNLTTMKQMFCGCGNLTQLDVSDFNTGEVTSIYQMFYNCRNLTQINVSKWDTNKIVDMQYAFIYCTGITQLDVSNWKTNNVTNMQVMFGGCESLIELDVSGWDTSKVTDMQSMFSDCKSLTLLDVSNWKTNNVTNMKSMFNNCPKLTGLDVSGWDTGKVTDMKNMFSDCKSLTLLDVSNWNTNKVTNMSYMFYFCTMLTELNLNNFGTSKVTNMNYIFNGCVSLTQLDVSNWNINNAASMNYMFNHCSKLNNIIMKNSNYNSVNKFISVLLSKTADSPGSLLVTGVDDISQIDAATAESKYWNVYYIIVQKPIMTSNKRKCVLKCGNRTFAIITVNKKQI